MDDNEILDLYFARSEQAIVQTDQKYGFYCYSIAKRILSDPLDAEESVNDTYLAAWQSMPPHRPSVLSAYLAKLTRRISIDLFRYRTRAKRQASEYAVSLEELSDCVSGGNTPEEILNAKALADAIGVYLRTQSKETQAAFLGRYYFLDPVKEIAAYLGITESKVKTLLFRTRVGLKEYLEKEGFCL